jgi:hypothetical protein
MWGESRFLWTSISNQLEIWQRRMELASIEGLPPEVRQATEALAVKALENRSQTSIEKLAQKMDSLDGMAFLASLAINPDYADVQRQTFAKRARALGAELLDRRLSPQELYVYDAAITAILNVVDGKAAPEPEEVSLPNPWENGIADGVFDDQPTGTCGPAILIRASRGEDHECLVAQELERLPGGLALLQLISDHDACNCISFALAQLRAMSRDNSSAEIEELEQRIEGLRDRLADCVQQRRVD